MSASFKNEAAPVDFVAHDWCGWNERYGRYTHVPSGDTLVCRPWMGQVDWDRAQLAFLAKYHGLTVHECPTTYSTAGRLLGTTIDICAALARRLDWR